MLLATFHAHEQSILVDIVSFLPLFESHVRLMTTFPPRLNMIVVV